MKKFTLRSIFFAATCGISLYCWMSFNVNNILIHKGIEGYARTYMLPMRISPPEIIIVGDSRAKFQIMPSILKEILGLRAVNIAEPAADLLSGYRVIKRFGFEKDCKLIIFSASYFHINDGVDYAHHTSDATIAMMSLQEKISFFKGNWRELLSFYQSLLSIEIPAEWEGLYTEKMRLESGFIDRKYSPGLFDSKTMATKYIHPHWYKDNNINGVKWRIFEDVISQITTSGSAVLLVSPPVAPSWKKYIAGQQPDIYEKQYSAKLTDLSRRMRGVYVVDYYLNPLPDLTDDHFSDVLHITGSGAKIFTRSLADHVKREKIFK